MTTPDGEWFCYARTTCDTQKRPISRCVCDSDHCKAGAEQKRSVAVASADSCSWISRRKHGWWKTEEYAAQALVKRRPNGGRRTCSRKRLPTKGLWVVKRKLVTKDSTSKLLAGNSHFFTWIIVTELVELLHGIVASLFWRNDVTVLKI